MAIALVAHTVAGNNSGGVTSSAIDTTGANLLVLVVSDYRATTAVTPTDSKSNSWTALTPQSTGTFCRCKIWYVKGASVGSGHTFTYSGASLFPSIAIGAFSLADTSAPFDQQNGAFTNSAASLQTGNVTPSEDNELIVTGLSALDLGPYSINGGFTIADQIGYSGGNYFGGGLAYLIQTTATAANPTWTISGAAEIAAVIATFKASAATPGTTAPISLVHSFARPRAYNY